MFKNALLYRIVHWDTPSLTALEDRLQPQRFAECGATQLESLGWVEPRGQKHGLLAESVGNQWVLRLCAERKAVPSSVVKQLLEQRLDKVEAETGRRPRGKVAKDLKEEVVHDLLPRAFPKRSSTPVWIDRQAGWVLVGAGSTKAADRIVSLLVESLAGGLVLRPLQTQVAPATAMAEWLRSQEAPAGFVIDRECELKQPDSEKATVRYARHTLEIEEVAQHISEGKMPTQLALTWSSRVSLVLSETLALKKIKLLDVVLENKPEDGGFDADVALTTGELSLLIPDLVAALGGELDLAAAAAAPSTPASSPLTNTAPALAA